MRFGSLSRPLLPDDGATLPYTLPPSTRSAHTSNNFFQAVDINGGFVQAPFGSDDLLQAPLLFVLASADVDTDLVLEDNCATHYDDLDQADAGAFNNAMQQVVAEAINHQLDG